MLSTTLLLKLISVMNGAICTGRRPFACQTLILTSIANSTELLAYDYKIGAIKIITHPHRLAPICSEA